MGQVDCRGLGGGGIGRHFGAIPSMPIPLVSIWKNVGHVPAGKVGAVLVGLHSGYIPLSIQERVHLGPQVKI